MQDNTRQCKTIQDNTRQYRHKIEAVQTKQTILTIQTKQTDNKNSRCKRIADKFNFSNIRQIILRLPSKYNLENYSQISLKLANLLATICTLLVHIDFIIFCLCAAWEIWHGAWPCTIQVHHPFVLFCDFTDDVRCL